MSRLPVVVVTAHPNAKESLRHHEDASTTALRHAAHTRRHENAVIALLLDRRADQIVLIHMRSTTGGGDPLRQSGMTTAQQVANPEQHLVGPLHMFILAELVSYQRSARPDKHHKSHVLHLTKHAVAHLHLHDTVNHL